MNPEVFMFSSRVVLVSVFALLTGACGGYSASAPSPVPSPAPAPSPAPTGDPSTSISIPVGAETLGNRAFNPDTVNVAVGSTVTWTNTDSVSHTSTSDTRAWDSGSVAPHAQFSVTFQNAGTFHYHCAIHPGMVGTVTVQ
jgi:plastocyanin